MDVPQLSTKSEIIAPVYNSKLSDIVTIDMLSEKQLQYVDYCVVQGLITNEDGTTRKMTSGQFADFIGVDRTTLNYWKRNIPGFWSFAAERRKLIFSQTRVQKAWNSLYLAATVKLDVRAIQTFLANADDKFRMPAERIQHEAGESWAELLAKYDDSNVIEGEVVDEQHTN